MRSNVVVKMVILAALLLVFGVTLLCIGGVVSERQSYRDDVIAEVARSSAGEQTVLGPLLVVPYTKPAPAVPNQTANPYPRVQSEKILLPDSLLVTSAVQIEERHRGIHKAQVFRATNHLIAVFRIPAQLGLVDARDVASAGPARLACGVSDSRGLHRPPTMRWNGEPIEVRPGTNQMWIPQGFSAEIPNLISSEPQRVTVDIDLDLIGTNQLSFVPVGASTRVEMNANWPDPSFVGNFLPDTRSINSKGFRAGWELSRFATDVAGSIERRHLAAENSDQNGRRGDHSDADFGVRFMEQVDVYQKSDRAVKYGMLFVLLTFVAFFVFEVLRRMDVHPMQYLLAGSGVALFFLLLLSLSEHIPFVFAYVVASGACVGLLSYYVTHVFSSVSRGVWFGAMLGVLYALLYVILESKDYALLLGTLLLFGVLAAVMVLTRRVDWYKVGEKPPV
jgi:inner membrane protein